jgi:histidinol dehydrogenase
MRILDWKTLDRPGRQMALSRPQAKSRAGIVRDAQEAIARVRREGDAAVRALTERFDGVKLDAFEVTEAEFTAARGALSGSQIAALERAITNVQRLEEATAPRAQVVETERGVRCELVIRPITAVGLYVPAGTAPLPSTVIMLAVPARIAGCPIRVLCTPPRAGGTTHPAVLTAAQLCGIDSVFKVGGAQAIAALAYGTESIPKVDKIFGPGNAWVTSAKQLVASDPEGADCDLPAGPSEVMVVADDSARADFVVADLLAQAEHDVLAQALLVTNSRILAEHAAAELEVQRMRLSRSNILAESLTACRAILTPDLDTALEVANAHAPEHLILQVRDPRRWLTQVQNAGAVFLGPWSPEPVGDYCSGTNHVLPTDGRARTFSGLSVRDFVKSMPVQELTPEGLMSIGPTAVTLARLEGLDAHANAVARRLTAIDTISEPGPYAANTGLTK